MLRTHYDNLKIARDAPLEVVRAAYRALSLKYHPDRHATDPEATEMMALINSAYEVLSDSEKRRDYDDWIRFVESKPARERDDVRTAASRDWIGITDPPGPSRILVPFTRFRHYWVFYILALAAIFVGSLWYESLYLHRSKALTPLASALSAARPEAPPPALNDSPFARQPARDRTPSSSNAPISSAPQSEGGTHNERPLAQTPHAPPTAARPTRDASAPPRVASKTPPVRQKSPSSEMPAKHRAATSTSSAEERSVPEDEPDAGPYTRPSMAPNGEAWPSSSDYVPGYMQRNTNGLSQVVIDNTQNRSDAYVKVVSVGDSEPKVVRNVFIQAADRFTVSNLRAGAYEVRYQNLDSGRLLRSEVFALEESAIASGSRYSTVTLTLHTRADEGMNTFDLPKEQF
jgi:hypothetical protein